MQLDRLTVRLRAHGLALYPPGATFGPRRLHDYEFVWILDGDTTWHLDGVDHDAPPGTLILCRPGMLDGFTWDADAQTRHAFVHFSIDPDAVEAAGLPPPDTWPLLRHLPPGDVLRPLFRHLLWLRDEPGDSHDELANHALRHLLVGYLLDLMQSKGVGNISLPEAVERALRRVQVQWRNPPLASPSLAELAQAAGVSAPHLCRLFKASLGVPPARVLLLIRLDRAATLLAHTNMRVHEIAEHCGFANPYHFTRCYRELFAHPPSEFRDRLRDGIAEPPPQLMRIRQAGRYLWDPDA